MFMRRLPLVLVLVGLLSGCGQTGPLYHPDDAENCKRYGGCAPQTALPLTQPVG
jgi:predicted small lipoprotein YifL